MSRAIVVPSAQAEVIPQEWGRLTWYANRKLGNSTHVTLGICEIKPGCANPMHSHPNCEEVLRVSKGRIMHTVEDGKEIEMCEGDAITVPVNFPHQARNIGDTDAVLLIAFTSADRQVKGE